VIILITKAEKESVYNDIDNMYHDDAVRLRSYYPDFRRAWDELFLRAMEMDECWLPDDEKAVFSVSHIYGGITLHLDFDQLKLADWYEKEVKRSSNAIFQPKRMKRSSSGALSFHESKCQYDPKAEESALSDNIKNIIACALPGLPPELRVIYGNKWVDSRASVLQRHSFPFFLLATDYAPAFLADPFQVCQYLFMMDYCIIKENYSKVKDDDLKPFLHIFRPSPMLLIKGIKR